MNFVFNIEDNEVQEMLGDCVFVRSEIAYKYDENKKKTDIVEGIKVFVLSTLHEDTIVVKVNQQHEPNLKMMDKVLFTGMKIKPYARKVGNYAKQEYSIKAEGMKKIKADSETAK